MQNGFTGRQEVYLQIADRYENYIRLGVLRKGEKLPSVRVAAGEMGVNPNTVQRAFRCLEERGLIETIPKKGVYVSGNLSEMPTPVQPHWRKAILELKESGVTLEEIQTVIKEVFQND